MKENFKNSSIFLILIFSTSTLCYGCTVKAVGDPERPITIKAHITIDVKGLEKTAEDIEDFVSGKKSKDELPVEGG